jgi:hypothetical protein
MSARYRITLRARLGLAACHAITYPYGIEAFQSLKPLTPAQRKDLMLWKLDAAIAASEARQARVDKLICWLFGAALVCLYSALDYGLSSWLLGF